MIKPEVKTVGTGKLVATFGLVVKTAQEDKDDMWIDVNAWETLGQNVVDSFPTDRKTMRVTVTGKLRKDSWEDKTTGQVKSRFFIVADNVAPTLDYQTVGSTAYAGDNAVNQGGNYQAPAQHSSQTNPVARPLSDVAQGEAPF
tara:strand:- start:1115 stop:1543 length:429 start_codon:yes stop_codon:yes gene_type:complete